MFSFIKNLFKRDTNTKSEDAVVFQPAVKQPVEPTPLVETADKKRQKLNTPSMVCTDILLKKHCSYYVGRHINKLVVHCAATYKGKDDHVDVKTIKKWHVEGNGWRDVGYHYVIKRDGTIEFGRNLNVAGAHVGGHNANTVGICIVGGYDKQGKTNRPIEKLYNKHQINSLKVLLRFLTKKFPGVGVVGHRDFPGVRKDCPGFDVSTFDWR